MISLNHGIREKCVLRFKQKTIKLSKDWQCEPPRRGLTAAADLRRSNKNDLTRLGDVRQETASRKFDNRLNCVLGNDRADFILLHLYPAESGRCWLFVFPLHEVDALFMKSDTRLKC